MLKKQSPRIEDYPPLMEWLVKHNGFCATQDRSGSDTIERWIVGRGVVVIVVRPDGHGWSIYTESSTNVVEEALADAEQRLGIKDDPATCRRVQYHRPGYICAVCLQSF